MIGPSGQMLISRRRPRPKVAGFSEPGKGHFCGAEIVNINCPPKLPMRVAAWLGTRVSVHSALPSFHSESFASKWHPYTKVHRYNIETMY